VCGNFCDFSASQQDFGLSVAKQVRGAILHLLSKQNNSKSETVITTPLIYFFQIVHRDLNPAKILITRTGILKLTGFELAKAFSASRKGKDNGYVLNSLLNSDRTFLLHAVVATNIFCYSTPKCFIYI
jgi:serine/threonine protein kinase